MAMKSWAKTDVGLKREINQDSIFADDDLGLYIVADGMGGHKGGEVASALAVQTMKEYFQSLKGKKSFNAKEALTEAYSKASERIYHKATVENPELHGMGTTMVSALRVNDKMYFANVGDSRAYLISDEQIYRMTEDHSLIYEQMRAGLIREEDINEVSGRNVITRSVGFERHVQVDVIERELQPKDEFLMCSDGLCGLVLDPEIIELIRGTTPDKIVSKCIQAAKNAGGDDNISVVYLQMV